MKNNKKYSIIVSVLLFIIVGVFVLQLYAKKYLKGLIVEKIPANYELKYSDLDINIVFGNISLNNATVKIKDKDGKENHTSLKTENLQVNGIVYSDLLFDETLTIKSIELKNPTIHHYPYKRVAAKEEEKDTKEKGLKILNIKEFVISNGNLTLMKKSADSIKMALSSYNLTISGINVDLKSTKKMPVIYDNYQLDAQKIVLGNNEYDKLVIDSISANKEALSITNLQLIPKYNKKELSSHLKKERDYIDLKIPKITLEKLDFNFDNPRMAITAASGEIIKPNAEIYRDKLIADDLVVKPLYSKSLRNLSFDLAIKQLKIKDGYISYAELVDPDKKAGKLFFNQVDATLYEISNLKKAKKTEIKIQSKLMGKAPLTLNWVFDVNNTADEFTVSGSVSNLEAQGMNPFFEPNLNALAEGTLQQMFFTFYANNKVSKGEMKMKYEDFNFKILRKDSKKVNKFLTAIGNIFIKKDSKSKADPKDLRHGQIEAERDATKSFFNYLWINVKSGVISTLTGNGKK